MTTVEVLKAARARIAEGWCQRRYELADDSGKPIAWCASGAISRVIGVGFPMACAAYDVLVQAIDASEHMTVSCWNDMEGRTKDEVLAAFDKAIALAEAQGQPAAAPQK